MEPEGYLHIEDRLRGRELVGAAPPFDTLCLAGQGQEGELPWAIREIRASGDALKATLSIAGTIGDSPATLSLTLATESPRMDLDIDLEWNGQPGVQLYLPLPFGFREDELRLGISCGHVPYRRPTSPAILRRAPLSRRSAETSFSTFWYFPRSHEPIPGDDFSWAYMQKWAYLGEQSGRVTVASGRRNGLVVGKGVLAIPLMSTPVTRSRHVRRRGLYEEGAHHWSLALSVADELVEAVRLGWRVAQPLLVTGDAPMTGALGDAMSLIQLGPKAIVPMALKRSANDDGWILRFFESTDQDLEARLRFDPALGMQEAAVSEANLLDKPLEPLGTASGTMRIPMRGFEIKTLTFRPAAS
ncbi:MAG: hypothetical protein FJZ90_14385 [Chloroflexi bacterium]|nr:hypothetical protein [Chloroflexota bacterium]